ncbi:lipopolysaccharide assembly protein LapB [Pyrococcus sp. ST04]|uniref:tetratricopeptide repeat protein n=1 Tax=Pyrococcus sp. ST04 TaxID=1183377 RepID=UPI00026059AF|nr:tetratricopeptide repeat protein [Pyrococcus sp. ST04]AFK21856.1 putative tetratricopeptide repeat domain-containing protein [Pyrococcus sp. ST04]
MEIEEIKKAIESENIEKVREILPKIIDSATDEELKEILEMVEELAKKTNNIDLYKNVVYYYAEFFGIDKITEFEELAKKAGFEGLLQLADLYALLGFPEKALEVYRDLTKEIEDPEKLGEVYYGMATVHEELQEYEKALELMKKAIEEFRKANNKEKMLQAEIYEAYLTFEAGDKVMAKEKLARLLPETPSGELKAQIHLAFEEIFEDEENYEAAIQECLYAMLEAKGSDFFEVAFDGLIDVIWQLMLEDEFEEIYNNMPMFKAAFPELGDFFEGVRRIALYKDGKIGREEVSEIILKVKDERLVSLLEFLGEAEL